MSPDKLNQLKSKLESYSSRTWRDDEILDRIKGQDNTTQTTMLIKYIAEANVATDLLEEFFGESE